MKLYYYLMPGGVTMPYNAIDLFSGCGGMTEGLIHAGFRVIAAVEIDKFASETYMANHKRHGVTLFETDIRKLQSEQIHELLGGEPLHLLAGCLPCQGFSSLRKKNRKKSSKDSRNSLILEYYRMVKELKPICIMLENVPGIENYTLFKKVFSQLKKLNYYPQYKIVNVADYGVPQRRKRLVMTGSLLGPIDVSEGNSRLFTVRDYIGNLENVEVTTDPVHRRYPHHSEAVMKRIRLTPPNGGSRQDLPDCYTLNCHRKEGVGFNDIYGRLRWDDVSSTITGGCLNPSKGRFLHPEENRCITAREAALLQTFRKTYIFPEDIPLTHLSLMIGNALPPVFCEVQCANIHRKLDEIFMSDIFDVDKRSEIMKKIKNKNTTPELFIRKILTSLGYKYRLSTKQLKCKPDIIFPSKKKAIFVNGCFWHGHNCKRGSFPKTNQEFWENKIHKNIIRDQKNYEECTQKGWDYLVIWQCEIKVSNVEKLEKQLSDFLQ